MTKAGSGPLQLSSLRAIASTTKANTVTTVSSAALFDPKAVLYQSKQDSP